MHTSLDFRYLVGNQKQTRTTLLTINGSQHRNVQSGALGIRRTSFASTWDTFGTCTRTNNRDIKTNHPTLQEHAKIQNQHAVHGLARNPVDWTKEWKLNRVCARLDLYWILNYVSFFMFAFQGNPYNQDASTIHVTSQINGKRAAALIDSRSTSSFINQTFVVKANCVLMPAAPRSVSVAGGGTLLSTAVVVPDCPFQLAKVSFTHKFRVLSLPSHDVIIGCEWFSLVSPISFDIPEKKFSGVWRVR